MKNVITFLIIIVMLLSLTACKKEKPTDISDKAYKFAVNVIDSTATYYDGYNTPSGALLLTEGDYDNFMNSADGSSTYTEIMLKFMSMKNAIEKNNIDDFKKMYDECKDILAYE